MKKITRILMTFILITAILTGCTTPDNSLIEQIDQEETYPEVPVELDKIYTDLEEIADDASLIVKVSVVDQTEELLDGYPQTHTTVEVLESYKGSVDAGDTVEIIEEGGKEGEVMGGIPQLSDDNNYILFLTPRDGAYYICGAFQGRFIEREGHMFQQATEDIKLESYAPVSVEDFIKSLG